MVTIVTIVGNRVCSHAIWQDCSWSVKNLHQVSIGEIARKVQGERPEKPQDLIFPIGKIKHAPSTNRRIAFRLVHGYDQLIGGMPSKPEDQDPRIDEA